MRENVPNHHDRRPLFPGGSCFPLSPDNGSTKPSTGFPHASDDQLRMIFNVIGSPTDDDGSFLTDLKAMQYIKTFPAREKLDL